MAISVAMAAYNGEKYIKEQLESILVQLNEEDEIVISLDPSTDRTAFIIQSFNDKRIKLIEGKGIGLIKNFENAIAHCSNDFIFTCDQDDIWMKDKVETMVQAFDEDILCVMHDAIVVDKNKNIIEESFYAGRNASSGVLKNLIKNSYTGCCMAFRKELKKYILPFPNHLPMHDQYIGLMAEKHGKTKFIDKKLILYRQHGENASGSGHASILKMVKWRFRIIFIYLTR